MLWLGTFGILPAALFVTLRGRWREIWDADVFLRFCIVYGIIAFAAGPALGTSVHRLVAYGWPAFAMGLPIAAPGLFENRRILLATHLIVGWLSWLVFWKLNSAIWVMLSIAVSLAGWLFTLASLKRTATAMRPTATPLTEEVA
jgi:hypothetical protein